MPAFTVTMQQDTARALLAVAVTPDATTSMIGLRVTPQSVAWEATCGSVLLVLDAPEIEVGSVPPGAYSVQVNAVRRIATIPKAVRVAADDQLLIDSEPDSFLDTLSVWPSQSAMPSQSAVPVKAVSMSVADWRLIDRVTQILGRSKGKTGTEVRVRTCGSLHPFIATPQGLLKRKATFLAMPYRDPRGSEYTPRNGGWEYADYPAKRGT